MVLILVFAGCRSDRKDSVGEPGPKELKEFAGNHNLVYRWTEIILQATANDTERFKPRPTVTSRYLALIYISMYDAWTRYDDTARPVYLQQVERRPVAERNQENKEKAISYAAYHALKTYFYSDSLLFDSFMLRLNFDPHIDVFDQQQPEGIGFASAQQVLAQRRDDGANQFGDIGAAGEPYFDYTYYQPVNTADASSDINRWQPKYFTNDHGGKFAPGCLTPHWGKVKPVALQTADQFRSPPPPLVGSAQLEKEVREVVALQSQLTDEQRALVEFMRDGPVSVQQAGHWLIFAQDVSARDHHTLDEDIVMHVLVEIAAMDAFIACWDTKMFYDFARPYALVHHYFGEKEIYGWTGPEKGMATIKGKQWRPYSPDAFLCPPFPAYVSGHSTVSGACSEILRLYTGDDFFGESVTLIPGALTEPDRTGDTVTLELKTFTQTADLAGLSRVLGGYHIQADNKEGLILGRKVGNEVWQWYLNNLK